MSARALSGARPGTRKPARCFARNRPICHAPSSGERLDGRILSSGKRLDGHILHTLHQRAPHTLHTARLTDTGGQVPGTFFRKSLGLSTAGTMEPALVQERTAAVISQVRHPHPHPAALMCCPSRCVDGPGAAAAMCAGGLWGAFAVPGRAPNVRRQAAEGDCRRHGRFLNVAAGSR